MSTTATTAPETFSPRRETLLEAIRRWLNRPVVAIIAVAVIAAGVRFVHLSYPNTRIFDEIYYSKSGCIYLGYSNQRCDVTSSDEKYWRSTKGDVGDWVHPPLAKWMIAAGELAFGTESFGWRVSSAVTGTATVVVLAMIVQVLFGSALWTFVGGLLLATESLDVVQSRTSMLDIFVTFWIVLAFLFLLLDRRWIERRTPPPPEPVGPVEPEGGSLEPVEDDKTPPSPAAVPSPFFRPWRIATGVALGAAVASKWSGLTAIAGVVLLTLLWEIGRRRRAGMPTGRSIWKAVQWEAFPIVMWLLVLPFAVYVVSYVGWFVQYHWNVGEWAKLQGDMASYSEHLQWYDPQTHKPIHPYLSHAWQWILLARPVLYFADYGNDARRVIYSNGNPAIFWGALLAIPWTTYAWFRRRDWLAGFIVLAIAALYMPWFFVSRPQFLFYATPISPFLVLADVYLIRDLSRMQIAGSRSHPYRPVAVGFVVVSVALFVWFWPVLTGGLVTGSEWQLRAWFPGWV
ncbi:MAG: dolichyl-phosphate-mannose--protein mannosyltransferase [Actinomycetota bacterium]